ncbi:MAG TPA: GAF domain-containing SpoIIE family protein phosphatase [Actinomycetota bacterium]|nr:GAF domain-containing SpoIIE family protein phosphatase [Actinomycetota bacterium]
MDEIDREVREADRRRREAERGRRDADIERREAEQARQAAERAQAEAEKAQAAAEAARREAEEARRLEAAARSRLQLLVEAGIAMSASLEVRPVLSALTGAAARRICDYSVAFLAGPDGRVIDAVGAHRDPARFGVVERMAQARLPQPEDTASIAARVLASGEAELIPRVPPGELERIMAPGEQLTLARELGFESVIVVPLLARGRTLGALALIRDGDSPPFDEDDLSLAGTLAARGGLAVDNARLYADRDHVAETLRRSLLPPEIPDVGWLEIGARYVPAADGTQVGGDFYDVFPADDGRWVAVIGDIVGKGAEAAAMMGLARYTIRTAAMSEGRPSRILETLNQAILRQTDDQRFCTACCVRLLRNGYGARVTIAIGGHPLPLVLHENGSIEPVGSPGSIVGVFDDARFSDRVIDLEPDDALVLYTDGVTDERRHDEPFGEERLREVLEGLRGQSAQRIADGVVDAVTDFATGGQRDDVALLVMKVIS